MVMDRPTPIERGYGREHVRLRREYLNAFEPGQPCARCELPIASADSADLDHTDDRTGYLGLSHSWCNRGYRPNAQRRAHPKICDICGLEYAARYRNQRYCSASCRRLGIRPRTKQPPKPLAIRRCSECGQTYTTRRPKHYTCSTPCSRLRSRRVTIAYITQRYHSDPDYRAHVIEQATQRYGRVTAKQ